MKKYQVKNLNTGEQVTVGGRTMERLLGVERSYIDWAIEQDGLFANPLWEVRYKSLPLLHKCRLGIYILGMGFVVSCTSVGSKYNIEALPQLSPGSTTITEAVSLLGEPTHRNTLPDGTTLLQWNYSLVVYTTVRGTHHAILFDTNGIMLRVTMNGKTRMN